MWWKGFKGYSLPEVLISTSLALMLGAAAMTAIMAIARGNMAVGQYSDMNEESRLIIEQLGRDVRQMSEVTAATTDGLSGLVRSTDGKGNDVVTYHYDPAAATLTRTLNGTATQTFPHISELAFQYLDARNEPTAVLKQIKQIQLLGTTKRKSGRETTGRVLSAQFTIRS